MSAPRKEAPATGDPMKNGIHFISGLPRSGSTLLSAILRQNPRFHAMMTSPVGAIYMAMLGAVSRKNEAAVFIDEAQKRELLTGVFSSYYQDIGKAKVVFDTNRMWCSKMPHIAEHFPKAKVIACVRHIPWIMDSIERLERKNIYDLSGIFGYEAGGTVYTRVNRLATSDGMVGYALDALREAFHGGWADRLILVTYESLTRDPAGTMKILYDFIGEKPFVHDFDNVQYSAEDFDAALGTPGLHTVRKKVEFVERRSILPPELFARFENDAFWMNPDLNSHQVPVIRFQG
ncbi:MAG: sulfotransferase family protein [Caulobacteraceae bacterium]